MNDSKNKDQTNQSITFLDRFFIYVLTIGSAGGILLALIAHVPALSSLFLSGASCALIYNFMGGIKAEDSFSLNGIKVSGSLAAFLGVFYVLNSVLEQQLYSDVLQVDLMPGMNQRFLVKNSVKKIGYIESYNLNKLNYYYIQDKSIVDALASLKDTDPQKYDNLVLTSIRNQCKERKGVCEYKFKIKVIPAVKSDQDLLGKAGVCVGSSDFWANNDELLVTNKSDPDRFVRITINDLNQSCDDQLGKPKKLYLFNADNLKDLGFDDTSSKGEILEARFSP